MVCQPRSSGSSEGNYQCDYHHQPYVECPANSAKTLFVASESPGAQPVAHVLHPQVKARDSAKIGAPYDTHLWASFAVFAKRVIHAMSEDHAAAARERDRNFAPVRREQISEVCSGANQRQSESCCPEHTL